MDFFLWPLIFYSIFEPSMLMFIGNDMMFVFKKRNIMKPTFSVILFISATLLPCWWAKSWGNIYNTANQPHVTLSIAKASTGPQLIFGFEVYYTSKPKNWFARLLYSTKELWHAGFEGLKDNTLYCLNSMYQYIKTHPVQTAFVAAQTIMIIVLIRQLVLEHRKKTLKKQNDFFNSLEV